MLLLKDIRQFFTVIKQKSIAEEVCHQTVTNCELSSNNSLSTETEQQVTERSCLSADSVIDLDSYVCASETAKTKIIRRRAKRTSSTTTTKQKGRKGKKPKFSDVECSTDSEVDIKTKTRRNSGKRREAKKQIALKKNTCSQSVDIQQTTDPAESNRDSAAAVACEDCDIELVIEFDERQDLSQQELSQQDLSQQDLSQLELSQQELSHQDLSQQELSQ